MARTKMIPGDIFEVLIQEKTKKRYFQYLLDDNTSLSANVIRVFNYEIDADKEVSLLEVLSSGIDFYKQVVVKGGVKLKLWHKLDNIPLESDFEAPWFRGTSDTYAEVKKSFNWRIWQANGIETKIGELTDKYKNLPEGSVSHPLTVIEQMETGSDGFMHPE